MFTIYHIKRQGMSLEEGYIGITNNYKSRLRCHKFHLKNNTHCNPKLQNAWNKYKDLVFEIIKEFDTLQEIVDAEKLYRPEVDIGWNCKSGGENYFTHSEETKKKISESLKGHKVSIETKEKQSLAKKGKPGSRMGQSPNEDTREKMRAAKLGKKQSKELIEKRANSILKIKESFNWSHKDGRKFKGNHKELRDFFIEDNLSMSALVCVIKNKYKQHKGWSIK